MSFSFLEGLFVLKVIDESHNESFVVVNFIDEFKYFYLRLCLLSETRITTATSVSNHFYCNFLIIIDVNSLNNHPKHPSADIPYKPVLSSDYSPVLEYLLNGHLFLLPCLPLFYSLICFTQPICKLLQYTIFPLHFHSLKLMCLEIVDK